MCFSSELEKMNVVAAYFQAKVDQQAFEQFIAFRKEHPKEFKTVGDDLRIFPNYYGYTIVSEKGQRIIRPMRYQLLPHFSKSSRYTRANPKTGRQVQISTFNARADSLEKRHAWKQVFGKKHCLAVHKRFFEYVEHPQTKKSQLIAFHGKEHPLLWSAGLWDRWQSPDGSYFIDSYAMVTLDPVPAIEQAGHDRMPAMIERELIDDWLNPGQESIQELYEILEHREPVQYEFQFA